MRERRGSRTGFFSATAASLLLVVALLGMGLPGSAQADAIPPDEMFFAPASLVGGVYPAQAVSGDGENEPYTIVWTEDDLLAGDPEIDSATITGLEVLPILVANPATAEGEYSQADLQAITVDNYQQFYHYLPGLDVYDLVSGYSADLTDNVLTLSIVGPGPYAVRVHADVVNAATQAVEQRSYVYGQYVDDGLFLEGGGPWPTMVHRVSHLEDPDFLRLPDDPDALLKGTAPLPSSDLYVVSQTNPPNNFEEIANDNLTREGENVARAGSPQDAITAICNASAAAGGPITVTIVGHGNGPAGAGGNGFIRIGTGCVGNYPGCMSPCDFGRALAGKVSRVTIASCYTGSDHQFLQDIANYSGATCGGYTTTVTTSKKSSFLGIFCWGGDFDLGSGGKKVKVAMADCNANEIFDGFEIERGDARDYNLNGIPDECDVAADIEALEGTKSSGKP